MGKMGGRDKASLRTGRWWGREDRRMFKEGDIRGNEVSMRTRRIATVTALKEGITKEDALRSLSKKFILARSKYVDKTSASRNMRRETKKVLIRKERRMRNLITQGRIGHAIDQIAGG